MNAHPPRKQHSFLSNVASTIQPSSSSPQPRFRQPHRTIKLPSSSPLNRRYDHHRKPRTLLHLPTLKAQPALVLPPDLIEPHIEPAPSSPSSPAPRIPDTQPQHHNPAPEHFPGPHEPVIAREDPPATLRFRPGDLVLCRYFNYPVWPATVSRTHQPALRGRYFTMRPTRSSDDAVMAYWVIFSGERVGGWVRTDCLVPYNPMYAHRAQLPPTDPIYQDQKRALSVAASEYNQVGSRFCYTPEDYFVLEELLRIPVNDFVDIKSQDSEADREPKPPSHSQLPSDSTYQTDSSYHARSSPSPPRRVASKPEFMQYPPRKISLRPRPPRNAHTGRPTLRSDRSSKPPPQTTILSQSNHTPSVSDDDTDALFIAPVKPEPQQLKVSIPTKPSIPPPDPIVQTPPESNPAEIAPKPAPVPAQKQEPRPFARRKRGRPRKHTLPVATRVAKQETPALLQGQIKREPQDVLTHIPAQPSLQSQLRRKRRGRPRKSAQQPPPPELAPDPKETTDQIIDRMQRRINRQEKQIMQMAQQQQQQNLRAKSSAAGPSTLPPISLLTKLLDPNAIRAQNEKFSQRILAFQRMATQFAYEAEKFDLAKRNCENAWKALIDTGRGTEQHLAELEVFLSKIPEFVEFIRTVRM